MKDAKDTIEVAQYRHKKNEQRFKETVELVKKSTQENGINSVNTKAIDSSIDNANVMMKEKFHSEIDQKKRTDFCLSFFAYFDVLLAVQVIGSLQTAEQAAQHKDGSGCQDDLGAELRIGKTVQSYCAVEDKESRDFQHNLS